MAHMLQVPEEVENAFLNRTVKAFTWVRFANAFFFGSFDNSDVHQCCLTEGLLFYRLKITPRMDTKCTRP